MKTDLLKSFRSRMSRSTQTASAFRTRRRFMRHPVMCWQCVPYFGIAAESLDRERPCIDESSTWNSHLKDSFRKDFDGTTMSLDNPRWLMNRADRLLLDP